MVFLIWDKRHTDKENLKHDELSNTFLRVFFDLQLDLGLRSSATSQG